MRNVRFEFRKFYVTIACCEDIMVATVSMKSKKIMSSTHTFPCLSLRQEAVNFLLSRINMNTNSCIGRFYHIAL